MIDEIEEPSDPPALVLKYLDDDVSNASSAKKLTRPEVKYVIRNVLETLQVLHEDGYVHTGMTSLAPYKNAMRLHHALMMFEFCRYQAE